MIKEKILSLNQLKSLKKYPWRLKKTVLLGGCFDIFHYAHYLFLKNAKKEGDYLILLLESDDFIRRNKKREPLHQQRQRAEILSSLVFVDLIILLPPNLTDLDYFQIVKLIQPQIIAVSQNDPKIVNKKKQAKAVGAKVKRVVPYFKDYSSTKIKNKLDL
jgi:cytidyltransferase-like protein